MLDVADIVRMTKQSLCEHKHTEEEVYEEFGIVMRHTKCLKCGKLLSTTAPCMQCNGKGEVEVMDKEGMHMFKCNVCDGTGEKEYGDRS